MVVNPPVEASLPNLQKLIGKEMVCSSGRFSSSRGLWPLTTLSNLKLGCTPYEFELMAQDQQGIKLIQVRASPSHKFVVRRFIYAIEECMHRCLYFLQISFMGILVVNNE
ncbi:hypothetical protein CUMW_202820 [Citrus unshiu]|uniref:Uncharacterized protein n=1 Tax=Citrus unshiu TaxID=55188 RepID=A0A2H5Q7C9_CITUN|nr:hypothetical protein CUMW_202820 [Citrus unshiu]